MSKRDPYFDPPSRGDIDPSNSFILTSATAPWTQFLVLLGIAAFWNGIVSIGVVEAVRSFLRGRPEWFLTLVLTPFVLIGLGLIAGVLYSLLALFNPRPILTINAKRIHLGDSFPLEWQLSGRTGSIRRLSITLQGMEHATYRRGTTTHTDKEAFFRKEIATADDPFAIPTGKATVAVPGDSMHTFSGGSNRIEWTIEVHGEIGLWPDVSESFAIEVHPLPVAEAADDRA